MRVVIMRKGELSLSPALSLSLFFPINPLRELSVCLYLFMNVCLVVICCVVFVCVQCFHDCLIPSRQL